MKRRHQIPTIFSIYMVDVLCCALGCVVLLWQVNYQEAEEQTAQAKQALEHLQNANLSIDSLSGEMTALKDDLQTTREQLLSTREREVQVTLKLNDTLAKLAASQKLALVYKDDYDQAKIAQAQLESLLDQAKLDYKMLANERATVSAQLEDKIRLAAELALKIKNAQSQISVLEKTLDQKTLDIAAALSRVGERDKLLALADKNLKDLQTQLAQAEKEGKDYLAQLAASTLRSKILEQDLGSTRKDLLDSSQRFRDVVLAQELLKQRLTISSKELDDARAIAAALKLDKINLENQSRAIRQAVENRFAGITLTGQRVVFLIDMSGSMRMSQTDVDDPDKWPLICETVGKIMRSLPDLKQYQVILFSGKVLFPLGNEGRWLDYDGSFSDKTTVAGLKAVVPDGETNMYDAFAAAFRYRALGLDTIYLLSDGLPTAGAGLPANANNLSNIERTEHMTRHIRNQLTASWNKAGAGASRVRINAIGFFFESPEVGAFLWALSRENDGSFVGMSRP